MKTVFLAFTQGNMTPDFYEKIALILLGIRGLPDVRLAEDVRTEVVSADLFVGIMDTPSPELHLQVAVRRGIKKPMLLFYSGISVTYIQECIEKALCISGAPAEVTHVCC